MAESTTTDTPETTVQEPAPVMKVTRAKARTSQVPRAPRANGAGSTRAGDAAVAATTPDAEATASTDESSKRPANVEIYQGGADRVDGDVVTITQGGATTVSAGSVNIRQGGIANAQAEDITVSMGGVALARADRVSVEMGGLGIAFAREAHVTQGVSRSLIAKDVHIDQSLVGTAMAGRATFDRPSAIFLLIAGRVEGPVQAMLDWRGAIAFGAAFGVVAGLLRRRK
jgi:hypothetical protein